MPDTDKPKNLVIRFFSNPLVGGLGTAIGIIGILLTVYLYLEQKEFRKLTFYVHPVKAAIVKAGQVSQLKAIYADKPINTDITAAQFALWNQGKLSIKSNDILKPVVISTAGNSPILEATIRKVSRDVTKLQLHTHEAQNGRVTISWQILEQNDGGIIQLIYAGNPEVDIRLDGVIEGQKEIERFEFLVKFKSLQEHYADIVRQENFMGILLLSVGSLTFLYLIFSLIWYGGPPPMFLPLWKGWLQVAFTLAMTLAMVGVGIFIIYRAKFQGPPFGF